MQGLFGAFQTVVNPKDEVLVFSPYWTPIKDLIFKLRRNSRFGIDYSCSKRWNIQHFGALLFPQKLGQFISTHHKKIRPE